MWTTCPELLHESKSLGVEPMTAWHPVRTLENFLFKSIYDIDIDISALTIYTTCQSNENWQLYYYWYNALFQINIFRLLLLCDVMLSLKRLSEPLQYRVTFTCQQLMLLLHVSSSHFMTSSNICSWKLGSLLTTLSLISAPVSWL